MKITFEVTEREARDDLEKANNRAYDTINAFCSIRDAIEEAL